MRLRCLASLLEHRSLWWRLTEREIRGRYRGSILGMGWTLITPLAMLAVYTFVFSQVFVARWGTLSSTGPWSFAVNLYAGLIVFNMFSECANRAPGLVVSQPNYVKKVIFPLEVLGSVCVGTALFHLLTSLVVLLLFTLVTQGGLHLSVLWLPLVWLPLLLLCLTVTWLLSALGVYLRDIGQLVAIVLNMLMFLSPIFYPLTALPQRLQGLLLFNPLAAVIEQTRRVVITGDTPSLGYLLTGTLAGLLLTEWSLRAFNRAKRGFADVL